MDNRGYSSGYSSWGGGGGGGGGGSSSRGSGNYDLYGYKDSLSGGGGYGGSYGGGGTGPMKRGLSGGSLLSSTGTSADAVIAKINQRLDMLTQLEGGMKGGGRSDRFDQYESFDSRPSSLPPRDLYRSSGYGFGHSRGDLLAQRGGAGFGSGGGGGGGGYEGSYGPPKVRQPRDTYSGPAWASGRRSPRRGGMGGRGFGRRQDPLPMAGGRGGHSPGGLGKLPSLLSHRTYPEAGVYQPGPGPQEFPGGGHFGGGARAGRQRGRKRPLNRQVKPQRDGQKKRKQTLTPTDEPESKMGKTETGDSEPSQVPSEPSGETQEEKNVVTEGKPPVEEDPLTMQEEINQMKKKLQGKQPSPQDKFPKLRKRRGFLERVMFACSICKFRSFYDDEMATHLESKFHKEHFKFLSNQLSKPTTDFLQEYLNNKYKKTELRTKQMDNLSAAICQVYKEQDLTRELGMEHFMKKVEAAHCAACDLFIPMQHHLIQRHLRSPDHNFNRKGMMEQSKRSSLSVARSILNHKVIGKKLESYLKGENPFTGTGDDQDPEDSMVMEVSEAELLSESRGEGQKDEEGAEGTDTKATGEAGAEEKMEEELEGVLGDDCLEGDGEEGNVEGEEEGDDDEGVEGEFGDEEEEGIEGELGEEEEGEENGGVVAADGDEDADGVAVVE